MCHSLVKLGPSVLTMKSFVQMVIVEFQRAKHQTQNVLNDHVEHCQVVQLDKPVVAMEHVFQMTLLVLRYNNVRSFQFLVFNQSEDKDVKMELVVFNVCLTMDVLPNNHQQSQAVMAISVINV